MVTKTVTAILVVTISAALCGDCVGAIAQVQTPATKDTGSTNNDTLAYTSNVTAGSVLIAAGRVGGGAATPHTVTCSDSLNGSWTVISFSNAKRSDLGEVIMCYFINSAAGANTVTISWTEAATSFRWGVHEYRDAANSNYSVDQTNSANGASGSPSGYAVTTTANAELILAVTGNNVGGGFTITAASGYTLRTEIPASASARAATEEQIGNINTYNADFTYADTTSAWVAAVATFKPNVAGGGSGGPIMLIGGP